MRYKLLNSDGVVREVDAQWIAAAEKIAITTAIAVSGESGTQGSGSDQQLSESETLRAGYAMIEFQSVGDGRGFSLAAELTEGERFKRPLYACGKLIPDQLSLAFQCGFDGVVIDDDGWQLYGESAWLEALQPIVDNGYLRNNWTAIDSIWERRQVAAV